MLYYDTIGATEIEKSNQLSRLPPHDPETGEILPLYVENSLKTPPTPDKGKKRRSKHEVPWYDKRQISGYRVSKRVISPATRQHAIDAVKFLISRGTAPNLHVALKPPTDHMTPVERMQLWPRYRQKF